MSSGKRERVILGIDPGTNILGFGVVRVDAAGHPAFVDMGVVDLRKVESAYDKLEVIHEKVGALCDLHHPDDLALESPFYGKNAQVILKLGRAQGAAMIAGLDRALRLSLPEQQGDHLRQRRRIKRTGFFDGSAHAWH